MSITPFERAASGFLGDLAVEPDGVIEGFCADPARPDLRCWVEIFVEHRLAATVLARTPRADLAGRGFFDTAHGFRAVLPASMFPARLEVMVWARVRGARRGFAQRLLIRPALAAEISAREQALATEISRLSEALEDLCLRAPRPPSETLRETLRGLSRALSGTLS